MSMPPFFQTRWLTTSAMQKQKRVTDFFSSPVAKKSPSASLRTPLFELGPQLAVTKKPRISLCGADVRQTTLDAGQSRIGGQYCKQVALKYFQQSRFYIKI